MKALRIILCAIIALAASLYASASEAPTDTLGRGYSFMNAWGRTSRGMLRRAGGYIPVSEKVGIGPVSNFIGYNTVEKFRLGAGFATTAALSRRFAFRGYGAYGFGDHRAKYGGEVEWALRPVSAYFGSYPINSLKASYSYDLDPLGTTFLSPYPPRMPFRLSLRHNEMMLYHATGTIGYTRELSRRSSLSASADIERFTPTRYIPFQTLAGRDLGALTAARIAVEGTLTPGGDIFQTFTSRLNLKPYAPTLRGRIRYARGLHTTAATDLLTLEGAASKLTPIGSRGATLNILLHGVATIGHAPYPFLTLLPSSPFILRQFGAFALLDPVELPADAYIDLHGRINDGGIILGAIPFLRPLGISLTASASAAVGSLSSRNDPRRSSADLLPIPGLHTRSLAWDRPYGEAGIGIDKFLGFIRLEYVWRLSYRDISGCRRSGLSLGIDLTF